MNPFKLWLEVWEMWLDLWFEVRALRECHNQDKGEIEKIKKLLIREGIWKEAGIGQESEGSASAPGTSRTAT